MINWNDLPWWLKVAVCVAWADLILFIIGFIWGFITGVA